VVVGQVPSGASSTSVAKRPVPLHQPAAGPPPRAGEERRSLDRHGLDASWDRKLARGVVQPDVTLDLHGATLDAAHARLEHGLAQALAQGARVMLLITGRPRVSDDHVGRAGQRGAIRAKFLDWLAAGPHAGRIAAIRPAHPRHGGAGAVYLVLRKPR
jgi:DNA-nicking Smr family endonuclease